MTNSKHLPIVKETNISFQVHSASLSREWRLAGVEACLDTIRMQKNLGDDRTLKEQAPRASQGCDLSGANYAIKHSCRKV